MPQGGAAGGGRRLLPLRAGNAGPGHAAFKPALVGCAHGRLPGRRPDPPMRLLLLPACLSLSLICAAAPALAAEAGEAAPTGDSLDLSLPQSSLAGYRSDPPGTWYGDTSGVPAAETRDARALPARVGCPTSPTGEETDLTGVVEAGIGHSSRGGNSNWQAATMNYCKEYATADGGSRTVNLQLNVGSYDGPHGFHGPYGPAFGPYGPEFGHGFGAPRGSGPGWGPGPGLLQAPEPRLAPRRGSPR